VCSWGFILAYREVSPIADPSDRNVRFHRRLGAIYMSAVVTSAVGAPAVMPANSERGTAEDRD